MNRFRKRTYLLFAFAGVSVLLLAGVARSRTVATSPKPEVRTAETERELRRTIGSQPLNVQLEDIAARSSKRTEEAEREAFVITTLKAPATWKQFREMARTGAGPVPRTAVSVTLYMELDNGYPFLVSGPPRADLAQSLRNVLQNLLSQGASPSGSEELAPQAMSRNMDFKGIAEAASQIDDRAVVLGFAMSLDEFRKV